MEILFLEWKTYNCNLHSIWQMPSEHTIKSLSKLLGPDRSVTQISLWGGLIRPGIVLHISLGLITYKLFDWSHYNDVRMSAMVSQITSLTVVNPTVYSRRRSKKTSKLSVTGLCAGNSPVTGEFPAQRPVTRELFPFNDVIMHVP